MVEPVDDEKLETLPADFEKAAAPPATSQRPTYLLLDADAVEWFQAEYGDAWQAQINGLMRFFMDTSQARVRNFSPDEWEPGEMTPAEDIPAPAP